MYITYVTVLSSTIFWQNQKGVFCLNLPLKMKEIFRKEKDFEGLKTKKRTK